MAPETTWEQGPPQRWARWAAWGTLACALPSALWRVLMMTGVMPGNAALRGLHDGELGYVIGLSATQVLAAVLVVGLVHPWGERLLGRRIGPRLPIVLGGLGGLVITGLFTITVLGQVISGVRPDQGTASGVHLVVMYLVYAPMVLFGPLTLVAVVGYALRRGRRRGTTPVPFGSADLSAHLADARDR